jgi:SAM-dependent methyltransferase
MSRSATHVACRSCGARELQSFLDLGRMPLADALRTERDLAREERRYPLEVAFCTSCSLVQILETVDPEELFQRDYPYYSSFSPALLAHSRENALDLIQRRQLGPGNLVVELASNDGYLLKNFVEQGIPVLGIDPAEGPVEAARRAGVESLCDFFGVSLARRLREEGRRADVIVANNVLAHVADTNGFVKGVATLLSDEGVAVIECPYVRELIRHCEFDTIYHEHLCYFSITALDALFRRHGLYLNDVRELAIHGGSLRLYVEPHERVGERVRALLARERAEGIDDVGYYRDFADRVRRLRDGLRGMLDALRGEGKHVAAYGAAAKGATLLNYFGLDEQVIDFVVDRNVHKHGKFMPGTRIPVRPTEDLLARMPDVVLLLTWNFKDEILAQQSGYRERGGRFLIPIPEPALV